MRERLAARDWVGALRVSEQVGYDDGWPGRQAVVDHVTKTARPRLQLRALSPEATARLLGARMARFDGPVDRLVQFRLTLAEPSPYGVSVQPYRIDGVDGTLAVNRLPDEPGRWLAGERPVPETVTECRTVRSNLSTVRNAARAGFGLITLGLVRRPPESPYREVCTTRQNPQAPLPGKAEAAAERLTALAQTADAVAGAPDNAYGHGRLSAPDGFEPGVGVRVSIRRGDELLFYSGRLPLPAGTRLADALKALEAGVALDPMEGW